MTRKTIRRDITVIRLMLALQGTLGLIGVGLYVLHGPPQPVFLGEVWEDENIISVTPVGVGNDFALKSIKSIKGKSNAPWWR